jgi:hypothetical protein
MPVRAAAMEVEQVSIGQMFLIRNDAASRNTGSDVNKKG